MVIYGKHPAFGDFLAYGMEHSILYKLDQWLEAVLPALRNDLGDQWEAQWAAAPPIYFWLGPDVLGQPLMGLFTPSQDKVGRRFPLMLGLSKVITPPPLHKAHDATPYMALSAHLQAFEVPKSGTRGAATLAEGFETPVLRGAVFEENQDGTLWAHRDDGDLGQLFSDAAQADADKAQLGRSHWWHAEMTHRHAGWLGTNGLPDMTGLRWLLTDRVRTPDKPADVSTDKAEQNDD